MKKHAVRTIAILLLPLLLLASTAFFLPAQFGNTYLAALCDKAALLEKTPGSRIVLIGGSGAAFGVDSELLESQFPGYRVVNFGLYAGLGTTVMLELARPSLRAGDVVVFSPEMSEQPFSDWFDAESMWQAAEGTLSLCGRLEASRWEKMLAAFPAYAAGKIRFFLNGNAPESSGVYARSAFSVRGDIRAELRPGNRMPDGRDENMPLHFDPDLPTEAFLSRINAFSRNCGQNGIRVYFRFCPMNAAALAPGEAERAAGFTEILQQRLHCEIIGTAERALMDPGWFYDTNFHLNGAGSTVNTALLAEDLKQALGDESPVTIALPGMPRSAETAVIPGDNTDGDCFTYLPLEDGMTVSELTEEGRNREELTVPASRDGRPVISFERTVFAGNGRVIKITLQANLRGIPDGAFDGCTALKAIVLRQEDPGQCTAGTNLLAGTDAEIYVPAESYGAYCTNYFWAVHAARLRPLQEESLSPSMEKAEDTSGSKTAAPAGKITRIRYEGNGGRVRGREEAGLTREITYAHLRENTLQGTAWFERDGYVLTEWNTAPDGSGKRTGLGSRTDLPESGTLYARWMPCTEEEAFDWDTDGPNAVITGYHGPSEICVLPETHGGRPVRTVRSGAFRGQRFRLLVLSPSLRTVEENAFSDCETEELILYDSLKEISDASFSSCRGPVRLRVNAATAPVYSGSYFDTFQDKYDFLLSLRGRRKLLLVSGSSGRYGYDSPQLQKAFPELEPVNMGVYAYTGELPLLKLMLPETEAGDVLLYGPEFDAVEEQFCVSSRLDSGFWAMMESSYDTAASLDLSCFTGVFDSLGEFLRIRARMPARDYGVSPAQYDDDGNRYSFSTYNRYGDFTLPRPNGETDGRLRHNIADYTLRSFPAETVQRLNDALKPFREKGAVVLFTYTPRNVNSLTEESTPEARAALDARLRETLEIPVISGIEDALLPGRFFWLIDSHLSTEGARIHTEQIVRDLQRVLYPEQQP